MSLGDVTPILAADDVLNCRYGDSEVRGDVSVLHSIAPHRADLPHLLSVKAGSPIPLSATEAGTRGRIGATSEGAVPSLRDHVRHILSLSAEEQMVGSDAERRVTSVQDTHAFRNGPKVQKPRGTMRALDTLIFELDAPVVCVSSSVGGTSPKPATFSLVDLGPEPNREGYSRTGRWHGEDS